MRCTCVPHLVSTWHPGSAQRPACPCTLDPAPLSSLGVSGHPTCAFCLAHSPLAWPRLCSPSYKDSDSTPNSSPKVVLLPTSFVFLQMKPLIIKTFVLEEMKENMTLKTKGKLPFLWVIGDCFHILPPLSFSSTNTFSCFCFVFLDYCSWLFFLFFQKYLFFFFF